MLLLEGHPVSNGGSTSLGQVVGPGNLGVRALPVDAHPQGHSHAQWCQCGPERAITCAPLPQPDCGEEPPPHESQRACRAELGCYLGNRRQVLSLRGASSLRVTSPTPRPTMLTGLGDHSCGAAPPNPPPHPESRQPSPSGSRTSPENLALPNKDSAGRLGFAARCYWAPVPAWPPPGGHVTTLRLSFPHLR